MLALALLGPTAIVPGVAAAQAGLTHTQDAIPVPRGMVRLGAVPSWLRYDSRFDGSGGTESLGSVLTSDALGVTEIPALGRLESALRALTGDDALRLSLGRSIATSSVRVVTTPISLEYGVTRRLSIGVTVPIVQRERELILDLETRGPLTQGNVGPVGSAVRSAMHARAAQLASAIESAAAQLSQRIATCTQQPATAGCGAIVADPSGAAATHTRALQVASAVRYVYGTSSDAPGLGLVPHVRLGAAIDAELRRLNDDFARYLGAAPIGDPAPPQGALGLATAENLRELGRRGLAGIGPDSLGRISTVAVGDVEIGARFLLWDSRPFPVARDTATVPGMRLRVMLGALARLGTGQPPNDDELFSVGAGDGQTDAEMSVAIDADGPGRLGATVLARYTAQFGEVAASRLPDARGSLTPFGSSADGTRTPGHITSLEVSPRYRLGHSLAVSAHYGLLARGDDRYTFPVQGAAAGPLDPVTLPASAAAGGYREQRAGFGVTYSTAAAWERGVIRVPILVSYTHLETFSGSSAMVPRASRDQIQVRLYYRLRR